MPKQLRKAMQITQTAPTLKKSTKHKNRQAQEQLHECCNFHFFYGKGLENYAASSRFLFKGRWEVVKTNTGKTLDFVPEEILCRTFSVTKVYSEDNNLWLQLTGSSGEQAIVPASVLAKSRPNQEEIQELQRVLGPVESGQLKKVFRFLSLLLLQSPLIGTKTGRTSTGWDNSGKKFYLPGKDDVIWISSHYQDTKLAGYTTEGDSQKQKELIKNALNNKAGIAVLASLASPLVAITRTPNFVLFLASPTNTGKTTALKVAQSVWGDPEKLMYTANITSVGLEVAAQLTKDLPLWIDEIQTLSKNQLEDFTKLLYVFTQGQARTRANVNIQLRKTASFRGILLTSGETNLENIIAQLPHKKNRPGGLMNRVLEVQDMDLWWDTNLRQINKAVEKNYGFLGREYVIWLEKNTKKAINFFDKRLDQVEQTNHDVGRLATFFALILAALDCLRVLWQQEEVGKEVEMYILQQLLPETAKNRQEVADIRAIFDEKFPSWIAANEDKFEGLTLNKTRMGTWGKVNKDTGEVFVITAKFKEFCLSEIRLPYQQVLPFLEDIIVTDAKTKTVRRQIRTTRYRGFAFYLPDFVWNKPQKSTSNNTTELKDEDIPF